MAMIDILRQHYFPRSETTSRDRKISGCHTKGYACLMGEKIYAIYSLHIVLRVTLSNNNEKKRQTQNKLTTQTDYRRTSIQHECQGPKPILCSLSESCYIPSVKSDIGQCLVGHENPLQSVKTCKICFKINIFYYNMSCKYISPVPAY